MMNGGQQIDPGLIQALQSISSGQEDDRNLKQQMALAQALHQNTPPANQMAGRVVVRQSPLATAANAGSNLISQFAQAQVLQGMQDQATRYRDARGRIMSQQLAWYNMQNDPSKNHPDTNDRLMQESQPDPTGITGGEVDPSMM